MMGRFDGVFDRLCLINRIEKHERQAYLDLISSTWSRRSALEWQLRLSIPEGMVLKLKPSIHHEGDGWLVMPKTAQRDEIASRVIDIGIGEDRGSVILVGLSNAEIAGAYSLPNSSCNSS